MDTSNAWYPRGSGCWGDSLVCGPFEFDSRDVSSTYHEYIGFREGKPPTRSPPRNSRTMLIYIQAIMYMEWLVVDGMLLIYAERSILATALLLVMIQVLASVRKS